MEKIIKIAEIVVAILLILTILMQERGTTLGGAFGGGETQVWVSRRGPEKFLFVLTIILAVIFVGLTLADLML